LSGIDTEKALPELEFTMNVPDKITLKKILDAIRLHGGKDMELLPAGSSFKNGINGLLNGVIDLLFYHNGKYYIAPVNYKFGKLIHKAPFVFRALHFVAPFFLTFLQFNIIIF
jgi:ATP-dependent exoDNAse (exonuclease V) beta subunit